MDFSRVKNIPRGKIVPQSDLRVGTALHEVQMVNPCRKKINRMIGTWNIRTMRQLGKLENIIIEIEKMKLEILGLCETRWPNSGDFWSENYRMIHSQGKNGQCGVGVVIHKTWGVKVTNYIIYSERIIMIQLEAEPYDLFIIQVYMPTSRADDEEIEEVYAGIEELLKLTKGKDNVIIMGDWNAVIGEGIDGREVGKYGLGQKNARGDRLIEFSRENSYVISNTLFKEHKSRRCTWKIPGDTGRYQINNQIG